MQYLIGDINNYNDDEINTFYSKIYDIKKKRIIKFKSKERKKQAIISEILLCNLLKKNNIDYSKLVFYENENGKPFIKDKNIYFNISHKDQYVVVVISNKPIGIDIEKVDKVNKNILNIISNNDILNPTNKNITKLYTLKEAFLKMKGLNFNNIKDSTFAINKTIKCINDNINIKIINHNNYIISICEQKKEH